MAHRAPTSSRIKPSTTRWSVPHGLALVGGVLSLYGTWTIVAWLLDGPAPITGYSDGSGASWWMAKIFEAQLVLLSVAVGTAVVRGCIRERRLTFDGMFVIAGFGTIWLDPGVNFLQPVFMYSSHWLNLNTWCGNMPGVVNPDCARLPEPILFAPLVYTFGLLAVAMAINWLMRAIKQRRPHMPTSAVLLWAMGASLVVELLFEGLLIYLHLWGYEGSPSWLSVLGPRHRLPIPEVICGLIIYFGIAAIRYFKDDRGDTLVERGLDRHSTASRRALSTLALTGFVQLLLVVDIVVVSVMGFYASPYPKIPSHLLNELCDTPGTTGSAYGPCPGDPDFTMPVRKLKDD